MTTPIISADSHVTELPGTYVDVIPFLAGVRLAATQQILVGVVLVVLMIRRPEGLLPEQPGSD